MKTMLVLTTTLLSLAFLAGASVTLDPVPVPEPAVTNMPREVKLTIASFGMSAAVTPTESLRRSLALGKDYLTSCLYRMAEWEWPGRSFITIIDSENKACESGEYRLSVTFGDIERSSKACPMEGGLTAYQNIYTQPYVGKICDREGKVLFAFDSMVVWRNNHTNLEQVELPAPPRHLLESTCQYIAANVIFFFKTKPVPVPETSKM